MQKYELMAIIPNTFDAKKAQEQCQNSLVQRIKNLGGEISFEDFWGERGFAYRIGAYSWGYYFVVQFTLEPTAMQTLKQELNIDTNVLRFLMTKVAPEAPEPRHYSEIKAEYEAQEKQVTTEKPTSAPKEEAAKDSKPKTEKMGKKLDAILKNSSVDL